MAHSESALAENIDAVATFTDTQILHEVMSTATRSRKQLALLLIYIGEMDCRRAHVAAGFPSAFEFCRKRLSLSEGETVRRLRVARAARRFPILLDKIASGELHLSGAAFIAKHLQASNARELIDAACGKGMHEIEVIFARLFPQERKRDVIRPVAPVHHQPSDQQAPLVLPPLPPSTNRASGGIATAPVNIANAEPTSPFAKPIAPSSASPQIAPLSPLSPLPPVSSTPSVTPAVEATYRLHVTLDQKTHEALREAQDLLRHRLPHGNFSDIVSTALQQLVESLRKRKFARTNAPRSKKKTVLQGAQTDKDVPTRLETDAQGVPSDAHALNRKLGDAVREAGASPAPVADAAGTATAAPKGPSENTSMQITPGLGPDLRRTEVVKPEAWQSQGEDFAAEYGAKMGPRWVRDVSSSFQTGPQMPPPSLATVATRYIPAHIKRAVAARDGYACSFVAGDGTRCGSRSLLEYHHRIPFASGGMHTVDNVGMLCRSHNVLAAEHDFGQKHQARFRRRHSESHAPLPTRLA